MNTMIPAVPRARHTDPSTSQVAAKRSRQFYTTHQDRILEVLRLWGPMNANGIGNAAALTVVQVDRRMVELQRTGLARVQQRNGEDVVRSGMRVWEAV